MPAPSSSTAEYEYALIRFVPRVERGECINVGVVLYCRVRRFLDARLELDQARVAAFAADPDLDFEAIEHRLALISLICAGDSTAGPIARLPQSERFGWLVAPASTVIQPSPVHTGLGADPAAALENLFATMVQRPPRTE